MSEFGRFLIPLKCSKIRCKFRSVFQSANWFFSFFSSANLLNFRNVLFLVTNFNLL